MPRPFIVYLKSKASVKFEYKSDVSTVVRTDKGYHITFNSGKSYNYGSADFPGGFLLPSYQEYSVTLRL
jgi:hypothetical protein